MLNQVQHDKLYNAPYCRSRCAFTLAEVLITLVIIGVVAALTIPNLMQRYQEQTTVKKVQKFYSNLTNAYALAVKENGPKSEWGLKSGMDTESAEKIYELLFKPYFKIAKNCGRNNTGNCITNQYRRLNNDSFRGNYGLTTGMYKVTLDDGAAIFWYTQDNSRANNDNNTATISYDTNGVKPPNQWGKDTFSFSILNDKIYPAGTPGVYGINSISDCTPNNPPGYLCAAWVVYKGNMDYLHCDVNWTGKDKCN